MDTWNDSQMKILALGGNRKLNELLSIYNIKKKKLYGVNLYKTKLLDFYRRLLKCEASGQKQPATIPKVEALKLIEGSTSTSTSSNIISSYEDVNVKKLEEMIPGKIDISNTLDNINYKESYNNGTNSSYDGYGSSSNDDRFGSGKYIS